MIHRALVGAGLVVSLIRPVAAQVMGPSTGGAEGLARATRMLGHTKRVLMIGAHPDDESTETLAYVVRREGAVAGYLSLTRGEGGQNLIGPELGEALGLLRTEELLSARTLDGAAQFFTRAFDFGYSKSMDETLALWPRDSLLKDVIRIVRRFRPQIVITIFGGSSRDGHGQHQAAGWVAAEAFRLAGDATVFPELAREEGLSPWQPIKLYRYARFDPTGKNLELDAGAIDPEVGQSYFQIAMRGRSFHRSQDMGMLQEIGPSAASLALLTDRSGGGPPLFAGIDTAPPKPGTMEARALEPYAAAAAAARASLVVDAISDESRLVRGLRFMVRLSIWNAGSRPVDGAPELKLPATWRVEAPCLGQKVRIAPGQVHHCSVEVTVPDDAEPTNPYFLRQPRQGGMYRWDGPPAIWGEAFDPPLLVGRFILTIEGQAVSLSREVTHRIRDQSIGELRRKLAVVPRIAVIPASDVRVLPLNGEEWVEIPVTVLHAGNDSSRGKVGIDLPKGWPAVPPQEFRLSRPDEHRSLVFRVAPPKALGGGEFELRPHAIDQRGTRHDATLIRVAYPHIEERSFTTPSRIVVRAAKLTRPKQALIGYVRGAADRVPEALRAIDLSVEILDAALLAKGDLDRYSVIVIGSRAYETEPALAENNQRILEYVRQGGRLVVQYQQAPYFRGSFSPFELTLAAPHDRVTDERAPVKILDASHPVFRSPNKILPQDWNGWVQERGLYFAHGWDKDHFRSLLETHDSGGSELRGGLLWASYGKGTYIYTGLAFFRQLPAGVTGAYKLFLNLLSTEPRGSRR